MNKTDIKKTGYYHQIYINGIKEGRRINRCSFMAMSYAMIYLVSISDDYGIFETDTFDLYLKTKRHDISETDIDDWLQELEKHDITRVFKSGGVEYGYFHKAPAQVKANGKRSKHYPHPDHKTADWCPVRNQWVEPGEAIKSAKKPDSGAKNTDISDNSEYGETRESKMIQINPKDSKKSKAEKRQLREDKIRKEKKREEAEAEAGGAAAAAASEFDKKNLDGMCLVLERLGCIKPSILQKVVDIPNINCADLIMAWFQKCHGQNNRGNQGYFLCKILPEDGIGWVKSLSAEAIMAAYEAEIITKLLPPRGFDHCPTMDLSEGKIRCVGKYLMSGDDIYLGPDDIKRIEVMV